MKQATKNNKIPLLEKTILFIELKSTKEQINPEESFSHLLTLSMIHGTHKLELRCVVFQTNLVDKTEAYWFEMIDNKTHAKRAMINLTTIAKWIGKIIIDKSLVDAVNIFAQAGIILFIFLFF